MMQTFTFSAMSTWGEISIFEKKGEEIFPYLPQFLEIIEETFSRFREKSELSYLNCHIGEEVGVSSLMMEVLQKSLVFFEDTKGIFNPSILPLLQQYGYHTSIEKIGGKEVGGEVTSVVLPPVPYTLDLAKKKVMLHGPIDLGGIVKGLVVDKIVEDYFRGCSGYVNIGGDLRAFGMMESPIIVGIEDPYKETELLDEFELKNRAAATSSVVKRSWTQNGENRHHLIHPYRQMVGPTTIACATVLAPTTVEADVSAKVFLLLGEEGGLRWIKEKGYNVIYVLNDKQIKRG